MDLLYRNLSTLISLKPSLSNPTLLKSIYKNSFQVPDQLGFQQIVNFLLNLICPNKCKNGYRWPLDRGIDRGCEKKFISAVRSIIMELREEYPQYGIPSFTASFLLNPSGPKFACLMIKLSAIALRVHIRHPAVAEILVEDSAASNSCLEMQVKIFKREEIHQKHILRQMDMYIEELRLESVKLASSACDKMKTISNKIKEEETKLLDWLANNLVIPEEMKSALLDVKNQQVIMDWKSEIENKQHAIEKILEKLKEFDCRMDAAYKIIKPVLELRKANLCLDGSRLHFNVPVASLEALVPSLKNLQAPLHRKDGTIILNSVMCISIECLKVLLNTMEENGVLNNIQSYPHAAIKEKSLRLRKLSATSKSILNTLQHLTTTSNQFVSSIVDDYIISGTDEEWMKPYRLEDLAQPPPFVPNQKAVPQEPDGINNALPGSMLIESSDHEEYINAILACRPESTPPTHFFSSSPVKHWISQPKKSESVDFPITTGKKTVPKASRLPVLCSSSRKYTSSVVVRSRLEYSCKKVNNVIEEEFSALDINIAPTPMRNAKSNGEMHLSPVFSPLATELPKTPEPSPLPDIGFVDKDANTPDILKHTFTNHYFEDVLVTPISGGAVKVVSHMDGEFDESNDLEICDMADLLNSGILSPTESIIDISKESFSCLTPTPSNCSTVDLANSGLKRQDCSVSFASNASKKEHSLTPAEMKKDKTPSTLERIISRYKRFKESKK